MPLSLSNSDIVAISAVVVAVFAMVATFWQAYLAHRHSRLSVRPHLDFDAGREDSEVVVRVSNNGLGTALVETYEIQLDGRRLPVLRNSLPSEAEDAATQIGLDGSYTTVSQGTSIAPGASTYLFRFVLDNDDADVSATRAILFLRRITLHIKYKSLYGEDFDAVWLGPPGNTSAGREP